MFKGKSLITGVQNTSKSLINPVSTSSAQDLQFGTNLLKSLNQIETYYVEKMALHKHAEIPDSLPAYLSLNDAMINAITTNKNSNLRLLFKIAKDGLTGAVHCKAHTTENAELNVRVLMLNRKIDEILSGKNEVKTFGNTSGKISATKTFKLAPIYSYYIFLYGMPAYGVGFDASKLSLLITIMQKYGLNPYK